MRRHPALLLVAAAIALLSCTASAAASLALKVDGQAVVAQLMQLAQWSDDPAPAVTRLIYTDNDMKARAYVQQLMREAGLQVREDTMGNIYGRLAGTDPEGAAVATGSHTDAIPGAGAYDGTVGAFAGRQQGQQLHCFRA
jgi:acetylornithine deacetylase/succinyl-diaminopimelate desuccinylase-like protein